jgi:hypothetical protein
MRGQDVGDSRRRRGPAPSARTARDQLDAGIVLERKIEPMAAFGFDGIAKNALDINDVALAPEASGASSD